MAKFVPIENGRLSFQKQDKKRVWLRFERDRHETEARLAKMNDYIFGYFQEVRNPIGDIVYRFTLIRNLRHMHGSYAKCEDKWYKIIGTPPSSDAAPPPPPPSTTTTTTSTPPPPPPPPSSSSSHTTPGKEEEEEEKKPPAKRKAGRPPKKRPLPPPPDEEEEEEEEEEDEDGGSTPLPPPPPVKPKRKYTKRVHPQQEKKKKEEEVEVSFADEDEEEDEEVIHRGSSSSSMEELNTALYSPLPLVHGSSSFTRGSSTWASLRKSMLQLVRENSTTTNERLRRLLMRHFNKSGMKAPIPSYVISPVINGSFEWVDHREIKRDPVCSKMNLIPPELRDICIPAAVPTDGNCWWASLSRLQDQRHSIDRIDELRVLAAVAMAQKYQHYHFSELEPRKRLPQNEITFHGALTSCLTENHWAGEIDHRACADSLGVRIVVLRATPKPQSLEEIRKEIYDPINDEGKCRVPDSVMVVLHSFSRPRTEIQLQKDEEQWNHFIPLILIPGRQWPQQLYDDSQYYVPGSDAIPLFHNSEIYVNQQQQSQQQ